MKKMSKLQWWAMPTLIGPHAQAMAEPSAGAKGLELG
jgi:hypothetical protein